jgi:hypothetical protein
MKKNLYTYFAVACLATFTFVASCKKTEEITTTDTDTVIESAQGDETISDTFSELFLISSQDVSLFEAPVINSSPGISTDATSSSTWLIPNTTCRTVTVNPTGNVFPKTVTIDYGTGCDEGGKLKKGKIIAVFSGRFKQAGTTINITFDNFYINGDKIEGTKSIVNNGPNAAGNYSFTVTINHSRIHATGGTSTLTTVKTITWIENSNTSPTDDEFSIRGSLSATTAGGKTYSYTTLEPLVKKVACLYISSGKLLINITGRPQLTLDYGTGTCDNKATLSANGKTKEITLRK